MLGQSATPPFIAVFHQPGPLGILWECLLYRDGDEHVTMSNMEGAADDPLLRDPAVMQFAIIKAVQPGSAADQNGLHENMLLGLIGGQIVRGQPYATVLDFLKNSPRPLELGFLAEVSPEHLNAKLEELSAAVPVKKGWMVKKWKDKKHKDKRYFVVDKRGLHYFKDPKDVIFDGKGEVITSSAAGTWKLEEMNIKPADLKAKDFEVEILDRQLVLSVEAADARALFDELDADSSGNLDRTEVDALSKQMGKKLNAKQLDEAMAEMDKDGSGTVEFDEFESWWTANGGLMPTDTVPQWIAAIDDAMEQATGVRPTRAEFVGKSYGDADPGADAGDPPPPGPPPMAAPAPLVAASPQLLAAAGVPPQPQPPPPMQQQAAPPQMMQPPSPMAPQQQQQQQAPPPPADANVIQATFSQPGPLGFGFSGDTGTTVVISVRDGTQAHLNGQVPVGSALLTINDGTQQHVEGMPYPDVLTIMKKGIRPVTMTFRLPAPPAPLAAAAAPLPPIAAPPPPVGMGAPPPPSPVDDSDGLPKFSGWLGKKSPKPGGKLQMRWFVLEDAKLSYYKEKDAKTMFFEYDKDKSGYLDLQEVEELCKAMGKKLNKKDLEAAHTAMDDDGSGQIEFDEFERWWKVEQAKAAEKRAPAGVIDLKADLKEIKGVGTNDIHLEAGERTFMLQAATPAEADQWLDLLRKSAPAEVSTQVYTHPGA